MSNHDSEIRRLCVILLPVIILLAASAGAEVLVSYDHYVYATSSDGIPISDNDVLTGVTQWEANPIKTGHPDVGNYGSATYDSDLATGHLRVIAQSQGYRIEGLYPYGFTATGRVEMNRMKDRLTFTVPAGVYPEGVSVALHGRFEGSITSEVGAGIQFSFHVGFGLQIHDIPLQTVGVDDHGTLYFDETILLTDELVAPGEELPADTSFDLDIEAYIANCIAWSVSYNTGSGYVSGYATAQFGAVDQGLSLTSVETPSGVTWTSQSGVFLSQATSTPPPGMVAATPQLAPNYPNPFNPLTRIPFDLPKAGAVRLEVYDLSGALVRLLADDEPLDAGRHERAWDGRDASGRLVPAGTYLCRIRTALGSDSRPVVLVK